MGGFTGESAMALVPDGAIEVSKPPEDGRDRLNLETREIIRFSEEPSKLKKLTEIFKELPVEERAQFGLVAAAVSIFLKQDDPDSELVAKLMIQGVTVPPGSGSEARKAKMLEVFK